MNTLELKTKPKFKKNQMFFHPEQKVFVAVDGMDFYEGEGKGWLYALRVYNHDRSESKPWKRYYEYKMLSDLTPLKEANAVKVLYGEKQDGRKGRRK